MRCLDKIDEDTLIHSDMGRDMGLTERQDSKVIEFPTGDKKVRHIAPWELEE